MIKEVNKEKLQQYNIYAGLGGSFGGAFYQFTTIAESEGDANEMAWEAAVAEYETYEGTNGISSYEDVRRENYDPDYTDEDYEAIYNEEREAWLDYYAVLTSEDDLDESELILDYVVEDEAGTEG